MPRLDAFMITAQGRRRIVVLVAALLGVSLTARLGLWQLDRAAQKVAMKRALDERSKLPALEGATLAHDADAAAGQHYRAVHLQGQWLAAQTVYLENRTMNGRAGFLVITPLLLEQGAGVVIVQRGWAARDAQERTRLPVVPTPGGVVNVHGSIAAPPSRLFEFSDVAASGPIRQNLDLAQYARETGLLLRPLSVLQADRPDIADGGLLRQWPRPALDVHKHYGYAAQWFVLAALMTGLYVWFQLIHPRRHPER